MHELVGVLAAAANPDDSRTLARYFRTGPGQYGEGDRFLGIKLSRVRALTRPYAREVFRAESWLPLLRSPIHEHRLACLVVMAERASRGDPDERELLYTVYLANTRYVNNWDLVDVSCAAVVGRWLLDRDRSPLDVLALSPLVWDRRIAMVSTHAFLRAGESADTYRLAGVLLADRHDLVHKATGWMLREAGVRVSADELRAFLDRHAAVMPRTMLRYAIERFPVPERQHYLGLARGLR
ncbi:MAG: DNA alkylation repair protein [Actinomycetes bacterium]